MPYCVNCGVQYNGIVSICGQCYLDPTILERTIDEKLKLFTIPSGRINDIDFAYFGERTSLFFSILVLIVVSAILGTLSFGIFILMVVFSIINLRIESIRNRGLMIQVSPDNLPDMFNISKVVCYRLRIPLLPVYIYQSPTYNAFTKGFLGHAWVVLHTSLIDRFSREEIAFIMGHEFAHIKRRHTTWLTLMSPASNVSVSILSGLIRTIFNLWSLKTEHTADRGGLLAIRELPAAIGALMKLATGATMAYPVDWKSLIREHEKKETFFVKAAEVLGTHPFPINRIKEVLAFSESKSYLQAISSS